MVEIETLVKAKMMSLDHMLKDDVVYKRWNIIVSEAMSNINYPSFTWSCLPSYGGYYDQDDYIMMIWECVRNYSRQIYNSEDYKQYLNKKGKDA